MYEWNKLIQAVVDEIDRDAPAGLPTQSRRYKPRPAVPRGDFLSELHRFFCAAHTKDSELVIDNRTPA